MRFREVFLLGGILPLSALSAQIATDRRAIEAAAASFMLPERDHGVVALEATPLRVQGSEPPRTAEEVTALVADIRADRVGEARDFIVCSRQDPSTCRLTGADVFVSVGIPEIASGEAVVEVRTVRRFNSSRIPLTRRQSRLKLVRTNGIWKVERILSENVT